MLFLKCSYLKISELAACRGRSHRMGTRSGRLRAQAVEAGGGRGPVSGPPVKAVAIGWGLGAGGLERRL